MLGPSCTVVWPAKVMRHTGEGADPFSEKVPMRIGCDHGGCVQPRYHLRRELLDWRRPQTHFLP
jgi:hypothetical protein